jgi:hypothetical protein
MSESYYETGSGRVKNSLRSGCYYSPGFGNFSTQALTASRLYATPFFVPYRATLDRIGLNVSGAGGAGCVIRLGIYADITDAAGGYPGSLILDAGTIDGTSATTQEITISQAVDAGVIWLCAVNQVGTAATVRSISGNMQYIPTITAGPANASQTAVCTAGITGALQATFGAQTASGDSCPRVFVRVV